MRLEEIEKEVYGNQEDEGQRIYEIVMLYNHIGVTQGWRKLVKKLGKAEIVKLLEGEINSPNNEKQESLKKLIDLIKIVL